MVGKKKTMRKDFVVVFVKKVETEFLETHWLQDFGKTKGSSL